MASERRPATEAQLAAARIRRIRRDIQTLRPDAQVREVISDAPRSLCRCGHTGDGPHSMHYHAAPGAGDAFLGHGPCGVPRCGCRRFRWERFLLVSDLHDRKMRMEVVE